MKMICISSFVIALAWFTRAHAQPHPWPFDFDPQIAADPARINQRLGELGDGLPGLPAEQMTELTLGPVRLYFFSEMADAFLRARDSGPDLAPAWPRDPHICILHADYSFASMLIQPASPACELAEQQIAAEIEDNLQACFHVEFPETYVYEYPPGRIGATELSTFEGLIGFAGEALTHVDYPEGLLPDDFMSMTRSVVAKIRHDTLQGEISTASGAYTDALDRLQTNASCFEPAALAAFEDTLDGLIVELDAVRQHLDNLYSQGLAQAALDRKAVESMGRLRYDLPHPALTDHEREMLSFYIGGLYWRMRGAGLVAYPPDPGQGGLRRLLYVRYPYQQIGELSGGADADQVGMSVYIQESYGWGEWFDMGTDPTGNDKYSDLVDMTDRGKLQIVLVDPLLNNREYDTRAVVAGGLQMGPCYYYAWEELFDFRLGADLQDPYMRFLECPTAVGEFCAGATLALGLTRTLLWGKPDHACVPDCTDRVCGTDGCGGSCGTCLPGEECNQGICESEDGGGEDAVMEDAGGDDAGGDPADAGADPGDAVAADGDGGGDGDARGEDAGMEDAGGDDGTGDPGDAGADDVDGASSGDDGFEPAPPAEGCGCGPGGSGLAFVALLLLGLLRRRFPHGLGILS